jgi:hypothetical protein
MASASTKITLPATAAAGRAMWRYATVMFGFMWRQADIATVPMMPSSRVTANERSVPMKVTSKTRTGMVYQRGECGLGIILGYTIS